MQQQQQAKQCAQQQEWQQKLELLRVIPINRKKKPRNTTETRDEPNWEIPRNQLILTES